VGFPVRLLVLASAFGVGYLAQAATEGAEDLRQGLILFAIATGLAIAAIAGHHFSEAEAPRASPIAHVSHLYPRLPLVERAWGLVGRYWLLFVALGLGIAFRTYLLSSHPFGVWLDEAENGIIAERILDDSSYRPVFITGVWGANRAALPLYVFAGAIQFFGRHILSLRAATTVGAILTIPFVFLLARELFDTRLAGIATFLFAVMRWHVNFSRIATEPIFSPLFVVASMYFLVRGLKRGSWPNFLASGLLLGLGLQFYWAVYLVPVIMVLYWAHTAIFQRAVKLRRSFIGMALLALAAFAAFSPVAAWATQHPSEFTERASAVSITEGNSTVETVEALLRNTKRHALMFNAEGDRNGRHNLPWAPMLDTFTGIAFVLGLGISLYNVRRPGYFLILLWVAVPLWAGIGTAETEAPHAVRSLLVTPGVALAAAVPLWLAWRLASEQRAQEEAATLDGHGWRLPGLALTTLRSRSVGLILLGGTVVGLLALLSLVAERNYDTFFNKQLEDTAVWACFSPEQTIAAKEMNRLGDTYQFLISPMMTGHPTLLFVADEPERAKALELVKDVPIGGEQPTVFLLDWEAWETFRLLSQYYPTAQLQEFRPPKVSAQEGLATVYEAIIEAGAVRRAQGLDARYVSMADRGEEVEERAATVDFDWSEQAPLEPPFSATWSGVLKVPGFEEYALGVEAPGRARLLLDGQLLAEGTGRAEWRGSLARGIHDLEVAAQIEELGRVRLYWSSQSVPWGAVPASALFGPPVTAAGLLGRYYQGAGLSGQPVLEQIDPFVAYRFYDPPLPEPFSVRWTGKLLAPSSGQYRFRLDSIDESTLIIDGSKVVSVEKAGVAEGGVRLEEGLHDIEVQYVGRTWFSRVFLAWERPGVELETLGNQFLRPG